MKTIIKKIKVIKLLNIKINALQVMVEEIHYYKVINVTAKCLSYPYFLPFFISLPAAVIAQGVVIGLLFVAVVSVTVHLYRQQPSLYVTVNQLIYPKINIYMFQCLWLG